MTRYFLLFIKLYYAIEINDRGRRFGENAPQSDYCSSYSTFDAKLDHFGTANLEKTPIRLITDDRFYKDGGPVIFYTGNEGSIDLFCENTGFAREAAEKIGAKLIFMEHRYYGKSVPDSNLTFLSAEQALADYAEFLFHLKSTGTGPVIALGGSYGGMLAAYIRIKYPNLVAGSIAASAPVKFFPGSFDCRGFYRVTTRTFSTTEAGQVCSDNIRNSWHAIQTIGMHMVGKKLLSDIFQTCEPITHLGPLLGMLEDTWGSMAMMDYPYPTDFMGNVPAWPVSKACEHLATPFKPQDLIPAIRDAASVYYNYTGDLECLDLGSGGDTPDLGYNAWYYQTCTEFVMPFCSDGKEDMFMPHEFDFAEYSAQCKSQFGTVPREHWAQLYFSVETMKAVGNIAFSNGLLDPWSSGGVLSADEAGPRNNIFIINKGAHHLDLRASNPADPEEVTLVRQEYIGLMQKWIQEANLEFGESYSSRQL